MSETQTKPCQWHQDDGDDAWETDCGYSFIFIEGAPSDGNMRFCAFCGRPLEEVPYNPDQQE